MAQHIVLMNLLAPLLALVLAPKMGAWLGTLPRWLGTSTFVQLLLLWGWHAPPVLETTLHNLLLHGLMQLSLFAAALWFWICVFEVSGPGRWRSILALLITGKLFCLLGVLLVFSPRPLYSGAALGHGDPVALLADQHLAGLLMVIACPATYLVAGVVIAARWFAELDRGKASDAQAARGA